MKVAVTVLSVLLLLYGLYGSRPRTNPPGVLVPEEPYQSLTSGRTWRKNDYSITALATFRVRALVISTENYWLDRGAELSPVDFALGWGPLSEQATVDRLRFSQRGRWFSYRPAAPVTAEVISAHSANMHMIPADGSVNRRLKSVRASDIVKISGYLVQVEGRDGFKWRSSLSRSDAGSGACELVWVEEIIKQE